MTHGVGVFGLKLDTLRVQQIKQSGRALSISQISEVGGSLAIDSSLLELSILLARTRIPYKRIIDVFKR
jgi:hypothetical protein